MRWVLVLVILAGCPERRVSEPDRKVLEEFRAVDAACAQRHATLQHLLDVGIDDWTEMPERIHKELVEPWRTMREHVEDAKLHESEELTKPLLRYLAERETEWTEMTSANCCGADIGEQKSTRLNSSHGYISYAVFCLKKKKHES